jgi:hypothetical protein
MIINTAKAVNKIPRVEYLQELNVFMDPPPSPGEMLGKTPSHSTNLTRIVCILERWLDCLKMKSQAVRPR